MMILYVGAICLTSSLMILVNVVANTVLYLQCKIIENGEEIAMKTTEGEVSGEYVRLTVTDEDDEVVHELAEEMNGGFTYMLYLLSIVWVILTILLFVQLYNQVLYFKIRM
ncbi:hypothetical protein R6Q59_030356 [Mikania micrantha]